VIKKALILVHRWLGVPLSALFFLWFVSGVVMMYWDFPTVRAEDRLERSTALDASRIRLTPAEAYAALHARQPATQVRLNQFDGRPAYRFRSGRSERIVYADTGEEQREVTPPMAARIASTWTGQSLSEAKVESINEVDQWTVQGALRNLRPLWKYSWPNGEQVYVSGVSGEVLQYTTTQSRFWAYLGAIPHWLYFTPLRRNQALWSRSVIWTSGAATVAAILGLAIGVWVYSPRQRYRLAGASTAIPYRGPKRWHTILGLIFGLGAVTWGFSGMLSMDPFPTANGGNARRGRSAVDLPGALRGRFQLAAFDAKHPREALMQVNALPVKELELIAFNGEALYLATIAPGNTRLIPVHGEPLQEFDTERLTSAIRQALGSTTIAELQTLRDYDAYYLDRHRRRPLPVIAVRLNDAGGTRYYIDPKTTRVAGSYSAQSWVSRWLYHGLHSLDFPWLYRHRPLWDIVVISFMLGGTALCVTSLILAWRVLARNMARLFANSRSVPWRTS
jgi:PepSY-associated TM region